MKRLVFLFLAVPCFTAAFSETLREPEFLDATAVIQAAAEVTPEAYPNADTVLVENLVHAAYRPDGTSMTWDDEYLKVLTEKGRQASGVRRYHFATAYGTATVARAEIIKPDGRVVPVDIAAQSRVMTEPGQMQSNIYDPNTKILQLTIPGLETGDVLHTLAVRTTYKPRVPDFWGDYSVFEYTDPIRSLTYEISAPDALPLRHTLLRDPVPGTITATNAPGGPGRQLLRWDVRDVPRMYAEPNMPPLHTVVQRLLVSTAEDWPAISRWYWNLSLPRLEATTPEMTNTVARLTEGAADDMAKVRALFKFVSQEIRYMGIMAEENAPGYEPHDVSLTFENKYGVCRDKAALLAAMLRIAGVDAYPVLIHAGARLDPDVPLPYFNHAITAARVNGGYVLMDPTDENTADLLPSYLCHKSYLVAHPDGEQLRLSPVNPVDENLVRITTRGTADASATLALHSELTFGGINDNAYRGFFLRRKPAERKKLFESVLKAALPGAEVSDFTITPEDLQDTSQPLTVTLTARAPDWPVRGETVDAVNLPWLGRVVGYVNWLVGTTGLPERNYSFLTDIACGVQETLAIDTSALYTRAADLPRPLLVDTPELFFSLAINMDGATLTGDYAYKMRTVEFSPETYQTLRTVLQDIEYASRQRPLLAAADTDADIRVLDSQTIVELHSRNAWTTTRDRTVQVLTYAGMKRNAELAVNYNPAWQSVEILSATVSNRNGTVHTLSQKEINEMDAAWVAAAPDYPAEKRLVASLPGVEIGSTIHTSWRLTQRDAPFFSQTFVFGGHDPVDHAALEIRAPEAMGLNTNIRNNEYADFDPETNIILDSSFQSESAHKYLTRGGWCCSGRTISNFLNDDNDDCTIHECYSRRLHLHYLTKLNTNRFVCRNLPPLPPEDGLPPLYAVLPSVRISSEKDFAVYGKALRDATEPLMKPSRGIRERAREVTRLHKNRDDRIKALRDEVLRNIRVAGPSFTDLPLNTISKPERTLERGYGHALDRVILLGALLRADGHDTELLFTTSNTPLPDEINELLYELPRRSSFIMPVLRILPKKSFWGKDKGDVFYLGDGDQYTPLGASSFDKRFYLNPKNTTEEKQIHVQPQFSDRSEENISIRLEPNGDTVIQISRFYHGTAYASFRKHYTETPPEELRREFLETINGYSRGAEMISRPVINTESYPGRFHLKFRAPKYATVGDVAMTLLLPRSPTLPLPLRSDRRHSPLMTTGTIPSYSSISVTIGNGVTPIIAPKPYEYILPGAGGRIRSSVSLPTVPFANVVLVATSTDFTKPVLFPPEFYPTLLDINRRLAHPERRTLVIPLPNEISPTPQPQPPHHP